MTDRIDVIELGYYLGTASNKNSDPEKWIIFYDFEPRPDLSLHNFGSGDLEFNHELNEFRYTNATDELASGSFLSLMNEVAALPAKEPNP